MTLSRTTEQELIESSDEKGRFSDGDIDYYFKNGIEMGYVTYPGMSCSMAVKVNYDRKWPENFRDCLNMTKLRA